MQLRYRKGWSHHQPVLPDTYTSDSRSLHQRFQKSRLNTGLVSERRDSTRIYYSLVSDSLALSVGNFLSSVCPEQIVLREVRKRRTSQAAPVTTPNDEGVQA